MPDDVQDLRTEAVENFLKAVYILQQQVDPVPTNLLAQMLNIKAPSVTDMVKRLSGIEDEKDKKLPRKESKLTTPLLDYEPYRGVRLTPIGEKIALEVIRHHRLLELYLSEALGYSWDEVHDEADKLEHVISERLEERIAAALGNPEIDPHGDPIPALDGSIAARDLVFLSDLPVKQHGSVSRIIDQSPDVLRYLSDLGLVPGAELALVARAPLNDTVSLRIGTDKTVRTISTQVARKVLVMAAPR
jgi:DtxR family transcriptional regulator, Mn-dependent transcriptional regulator